MRCHFQRSGLSDRNGAREGKGGVVLTKARQAGAGNLEILCVDDNLMNLKLLSAILGRAGHHVTCASDGLEAWAAIEASPSRSDVLITDHDMPNLNGLGLVNRLRGLPFQGKIILNSATVTEEDIISYERETIEASVPKPLNPGKLLEAVRRCRRG